MRPDILEVVKALSAADHKTLSQKGLKTAEEVGELAKAILPYEQAAGTIHRIVTKRKILEESVDTILCALSVAYSLDFTDEDIASMMQEKSLFWDSLQKNQEGKDRIPFEVHVTVEDYSAHSDATPETSAWWDDKFRHACEKVGAKAIFLNLHTPDGRVIRDVMTSKVVMGNTSDAMRVMEETVKCLRVHYFKVIREKIECVPWHPSVPQTEADKKDEFKSRYFEAHFEYVLTSEQNLALQKYAREFGIALSYNTRKVMEDGSITAAITVRRYDSCLEDFKTSYAMLLECLEHEGYQLVGRHHVEYCVHDTNPGQDKEWLGA